MAKSLDSLGVAAAWATLVLAGALVVLTAISLMR